MPNNVRVSLCTNKGAQRGSVRSGVMVKPFFSDIVRVATNKLKLKKSQRKNCRLFIYKDTKLAKAGTELPVAMPSCSAHASIFCFH
jgi:hypothetical protein